MFWCIWKWIRQAAGERFTNLELNLLIPAVAVTDNRRRSAEEIHREWEMPNDAFTVEQLLDSPSFLIGSIEQIIEQLQMLRENYGISYYSVWDDAMESFAPVVARLAGM